ncbi:hypothetical protein [Amycolatopsis suaedae]|uniref:hypothetical protein n=1 Tax=Amycolatopsis suaedae TaxID=2510978 RepID=UPI00196A91EE|nr:hypothetical protein [Amycolatopsis suaedae]
MPYRQLDADELRAIHPALVAAAEMFNAPDFRYPEIDLDGLRARHPGLLTFPAWLDRGGAAAIAGLLG